MSVTCPCHSCVWWAGAHLPKSLSLEMCPQWELSASLSLQRPQSLSPCVESIHNVGHTYKMAEANLIELVAWTITMSRCGLEPICLSLGYEDQAEGDFYTGCLHLTPLSTSTRERGRNTEALRVHCRPPLVESHWKDNGGPQSQVTSLKS